MGAKDQIKKRKGDEDAKNEKLKEKEDALKKKNEKKVAEDRMKMLSDTSKVEEEQEAAEKEAENNIDNVEAKEDCKEVDKQIAAMKTFELSVKKLAWAKYVKLVGEKNRNMWKVMKEGSEEATQTLIRLAFAKKQELKAVNQRLPELERFYPKLAAPPPEVLEKNISDLNETLELLLQERPRRDKI